jgi:hypothetical protein
MMGMTANSSSLSAVSWEASLVKTAPTLVGSKKGGFEEHTQTWCEERDIQVGQELLFVGIEHALLGNNVTRQTDADHFHDGLEYQKYQMPQGRMRIMARCNHARHQSAEGLSREGSRCDRSCLIAIV